jgi:hypothetical protein
VAQSVGPEFKPQYGKKEKRKISGVGHATICNFYFYLCDPKFEKPPFFGFAMAPNKE